MSLFLHFFTILQNQNQKLSAPSTSIKQYPIKFSKFGFQICLQTGTCSASSLTCCRSSSSHWASSGSSLSGGWVRYTPTSFVWITTKRDGKAPRADQSAGLVRLLWFEWWCMVELSAYTALKILFMYSQKRNCAPQSQFLHSCVCERFIYSQDQSTYLAAAK
jgi:hypothetical protein